MIARRGLYVWKESDQVPKLLHAIGHDKHVQVTDSTEAWTRLNVMS